MSTNYNHSLTSTSTTNNATAAAATNRHSENVDTWSHITTNLLHLWIEDQQTNVRKNISKVFDNDYIFFSFSSSLSIVEVQMNIVNHMQRIQ